MKGDSLLRSLLCQFALLALFAPLPVHAYPVGPPIGLGKLEAEADFVCKARVVSSAVITNAWFKKISGFQVEATTLKVISVLKGASPEKEFIFQHYALSRGEPMMYSPQHYELDLGKTYLFFASKSERAGEFRQLHLSHTGKDDEGVTRTLDERPIAKLSIKEAHWFELNLLLTNSASSNSLYAIKQLDAMSKSCQRDWGHTDDFAREAVLNALSLLITNLQDEVAITAINCFQTTAPAPECATQLSSHANSLVAVANGHFSAQRQIAAIAALSGTRFTEVRDSLLRLLNHSEENVRAQTVSLLPRFPGEFSEGEIRKHATDESLQVRVAVAEAIGNGKFKSLLPTLEKLLSEPREVHKSAGEALLKFDVEQVKEILKKNLGDAEFRPDYLCKLAEKNPEPWLTNLVEVLEVRREKMKQQAETSGAEPKAAYFQGLMSLAGTPFKCWNIIYDHLSALPNEAFADGKLDRCLVALEKAGNTGSREPTKLYELYRQKGLPERALKFRSESEKDFPNYNLKEFFDRLDRSPNN